LFPQPSTAFFQAAKVLGVAREVPAVHVEEELRGDVQRGRLADASVSAVSICDSRVVLVGRGGAGMQREPDVVRAGRPLERPDANQSQMNAAFSTSRCAFPPPRGWARRPLAPGISEGVPDTRGGSAMP
jgi:hypothetical protein